MEPAARMTDPVGHSLAMMGLVGGLLIGAAIGVLCVATGGAGLAVVALAASAGAGIGEVLGSLSVLPLVNTGCIMTGSQDIWINNEPAARASLDTDVCAGMPFIYIPCHGTNPVAEGSSNVFFNGMPAARRGDKTMCGSKIQEGSPDVFIGGGTQTTEVVQPEVPLALNLAVMALGAGAALVVLGPVAGLTALLGSYYGGQFGNWLGAGLFGEGSDGQKLLGLTGAIVGGAFGGKAGLAPRGPRVPPAEPPPEPPALPKGTGEETIVLRSDKIDLDTVPDGWTKQVQMMSPEDYNRINASQDVAKLNPAKYKPLGYVPGRWVDSPADGVPEDPVEPPDEPPADEVTEELPEESSPDDEMAAFESVRKAISDNLERSTRNLEDLNDLLTANDEMDPDDPRKLSPTDEEDAESLHDYAIDETAGFLKVAKAMGVPRNVTGPADSELDKAVEIRDGKVVKDEPGGGKPPDDDEGGGGPAGDDGVGYWPSGDDKGGAGPN